MTYDLEEEERQAILLAIAHLAVARPGWEPFLAHISHKLDGVAMYRWFHRLKSEDEGTPD